MKILNGPPNKKKFQKMASGVGAGTGGYLNVTGLGFQPKYIIARNVNAGSYNEQGSYNPDFTNTVYSANNVSSRISVGGAMTFAAISWSVSGSGFTLNFGYISNDRMEWIAFGY